MTKYNRNIPTITPTVSVIALAQDLFVFIAKEKCISVTRRSCTIRILTRHLKKLTVRYEVLSSRIEHFGLTTMHAYCIRVYFNAVGVAVVELTGIKNAISPLNVLCVYFKRILNQLIGKRIWIYSVVALRYKSITKCNKL